MGKLTAKEIIHKPMVQFILEKLKNIRYKKAVLFVLKNRKESQEFYQHYNWNKDNIVYIYSKVISNLLNLQWPTGCNYRGEDSYH